MHLLLAKKTQTLLLLSVLAMTTSCSDTELMATKNLRSELGDKDDHLKDRNLTTVNKPFEETDVRPSQFAAIKDVVHDIIVTDDDGLIIAADWFLDHPELESAPLLKISENGEVDEEFFNNISQHLAGEVFSIAVDQQGRIWLGGDFLLKPEAVISNLIRLDPTGMPDHPDLDFKGTDGAVTSIKVADNELVITGDFSTYNELPVSGRVVLNLDSRLADVEPDANKLDQEALPETNAVKEEVEAEPKPESTSISATDDMPENFPAEVAGILSSDEAVLDSSEEWSKPQFIKEVSGLGQAAKSKATKSKAAKAKDAKAAKATQASGQNSKSKKGKQSPVAPALKAQAALDKSATKTAPLKAQPEPSFVSAHHYQGEVVSRITIEPSLTILGGMFEVKGKSKKQGLIAIQNSAIDREFRLDGYDLSQRVTKLIKLESKAFIAVAQGSGSDQKVLWLVKLSSLEHGKAQLLGKTDYDIEQAWMRGNSLWLKARGNQNEVILMKATNDDDYSKWTEYSDFGTR